MNELFQNDIIKTVVGGVTIILVVFVCKSIWKHREQIKLFFNKEEKFKKHIESSVKLATANCYPVRFVLNSSQAHASIYMFLNNFSSRYKLRFDGISIINLGIRSNRGNHTVFTDKQFIDTFDIAKNDSTDIYTKFDLNRDKEKLLRSIEPYNCETNIHFYVHVSSGIFKTKIDASFDCIPCEVSLSKSPLTEYKETLKEKVCDECSKKLI